MRSEPDLVDEPGGDQLVDNRVDLQAGQQVAAEARPDDRRGGKGVLGGRTEPVDACGDGGPQRRRHTDLGHVGVAGVAASRTDQHAALGQITGDLLGEKGVSGRAPDDDLADLANGRIGAQQFGNQR